MTSLKAMTAVQLDRLDLNLLVVFQKVAAEGSVTRAANALGLSQPAVSNALAKLRRSLDDPLVVRAGAGVALTPFAERLFDSLNRSLPPIRAAIELDRVFDAGSSARSFSIGVTDVGEIYFLPRLLQRMQSDAPGIHVSSVRNAAVDVRGELEAGRVDLALGYLPQLRGGFYQRRLFMQRYVCLMRAGHALAGSGRSWAKGFAEADHLVVVSKGTGHDRVDQLLALAVPQRQIRLAVPHFIAVGHLLRDSDMVATVPERLAQCLVEPFSLVVKAHPIRLPATAISMFWHARLHRDPANVWLRHVVGDLFGQPA